MFPLYDLSQDCGKNPSKKLTALELSRKAYFESCENSGEFTSYWLALFYFFENQEIPEVQNSGEILSVLQGYSLNGPVKYKMFILMMFVLECERLGEDYLNKEIKALAAELVVYAETQAEKEFFGKRFENNYIDFSFLKGKEKLTISLLEKSSMSKFELIEAIYGKSCDFITSEKRFKALLNRIRKKISCDLILNTHGQYQLVL